MFVFCRRWCSACSCRFDLRVGGLDWCLWFTDRGVLCGFVFLWAGLGVVFGVSWALRLVWAWFAGVFGFVVARWCRWYFWFWFVVYRVLLLWVVWGSGW